VSRRVRIEVTVEVAALASKRHWDGAVSHARLRFCNADAFAERRKPVAADGIWDIVVHNPMGNIDVRLDLATDGNVLTGTASGNGQTVSVDDGSVDGDDLSFNITITSPMRMKLKFALTMSGDTISGTSKPRALPAARVTGGRAAT
jgi:hypothetical protein